MPKVTEGRIVHYVQQAGGRHYPALVMTANDPDSPEPGDWGVHLRIFRPMSANPGDRDLERTVYAYDPDGIEPDSWHWPEQGPKAAPVESRAKINSDMVVQDVGWGIQKDTAQD